MTDDFYTLTCPLRDGPPLEVPVHGRLLAAQVRQDRCPISGRELAPQNAVVGLSLMGSTVEDTRGRCPEPCETVWWIDPSGSPCYAGRLVTADFPEDGGP